ncbi:sulfatase family protein [Nocardioides jishulii]|uniref:Sulfatase n=1 Tax=Nocardioides jishulii TaxID=2575440 RepID=A0A4U2YS01_9ACTN|nr:sulfatase [Nocardioides jishulii]QCX28903.1 sulfatase [Nocardioides jishulii]TKI64199.1 sulfatase [Nocardioides jishulii]
MIKRPWVVGIAAAATMATLASGCTATDEATAKPGPGTASEVPRAPESSRTDKPNILLITVDDASATDVLDMPHVQRLIADQGATVDTAVAPTPICVPARASLLTGQYTHNHGALGISGPYGSVTSFMGEDKDDDTLPVWLNEAGYETFFVGKYLNGYGKSDETATYVPPGWTRWLASVDTTTYDYDKTQLTNNGAVEQVETTYNSDGFGARVDDLLSQPRRTSRPWFMTVNYVAPHFGGPWEDDDPKYLEQEVRGNDSARTNPRFPPTPYVHPDDRDTFATRDLPDDPSMFYDVPDQQAGQERKFTPKPKRQRYLRELNQQRIESLQAVDRAVGRHIEVLEESGQLDDTVVVFTSDNGYSVGQHNLDGKLFFYEPQLTVPLVIRGPGIPRGTDVESVVTHADLPVTLAAMAGATPTRPVDGLDVSRLLERPEEYVGRVVPIEGYAVDAQTDQRLYSGVRVGNRWKYARLKSGFEEVYDLVEDPYELTNLAERRPELTSRLRALDERYRDCAAATCPQLGEVPEVE